MNPDGDFDFAAAIKRLIDAGGSDLHLKVGNRPLMRVHGELGYLDETSRPLTPPDTEELLHELLPDSRIKEFEYAHELDAAYSVPGLARFRLNAYKQRGCVSLVLRVIPQAVQSVSELGLPEVVAKLAEAARGIVLVTGSTGSGKSTTLAAMIAQINAHAASTSSRSRIRSSTCTRTTALVDRPARGGHGDRLVRRPRSGACCARTRT